MCIQHAADQRWGQKFNLRFQWRMTTLIHAGCHPSDWTLDNHYQRKVRSHFQLFKMSDTCLGKMYLSLATSGSCPPLFTLDTLLVFLDTLMKHWTCEEFLLLETKKCKDSSFSQHINVFYMTNSYFIVTFVVPWQCWVLWVWQLQLLHKLQRTYCSGVSLTY